MVIPLLRYVFFLVFRTLAPSTNERFYLTTPRFSSRCDSDCLFHRPRARRSQSDPAIFQVGRRYAGSLGRETRGKRRGRIDLSYFVIIYWLWSAQTLYDVSYQSEYIIPLHQATSKCLMSRRRYSPSVFQISTNMRLCPHGSSERRLVP